MTRSGELHQRFPFLGYMHRVEMAIDICLQDVDDDGDMKRVCSYKLLLHQEGGYAVLSHKDVSSNHRLVVEKHKDYRQGYVVICFSS